MNLSKRFERSSRRVWRLKEKPDDSTLLNLYALYKQATEGDAKSPHPIPDGMVGMAKWRAWRRLRGCLLYPSDAADDIPCFVLGCRRSMIKQITIIDK